MTFYNIIFGILFLGACQSVLISLTQSTDTLFFVFVTLLIFNDAVNTSEAIEERKFDYSIKMKLLDLASFLVLGATLVLLSENTKNFLDVAVYAALPEKLKHPSVPPLLLLVYSALVAGWNMSSSQIKKPAEWPKMLKISAALIILSLFLLLFLRPHKADYAASYTILVAIGIASTFGYLVSYAYVKKE